MGDIAKVMQYRLRYLDGFTDFHEMQKHLWTLQRHTREIMNKTIQEAYAWDYRSNKTREETGNYLDVLTETGYKRLDGYIYNVLKTSYPDMASRNLASTLRRAWQKYINSRKDVFAGKMSLPSYREDQPLIINKNCVKLSGDVRDVTADINLFSNNFKKQNGLNSNVRFQILLYDKRQRSIMEALLAGDYKQGECQIVYRKEKWFLYLTYIHAGHQHPLDPDKILGVNLGETVAMYASSLGRYGSLKIEGDEVVAYAAQLEKRRRALQHQAKYCGEGRIGHGRKTRVAPVYKAGNREAAFQDTINHRYSKKLIDYAVKNGYGTIQMEDFTTFKANTDYPKMLRKWTYYNLQSKIKAKAVEHGVTVTLIDPKYASQRCSRCGHISKENHPSPGRFHCMACGFESNADFNASQNISIKGIEDIISKTTKCEDEADKES